jgi:hypothetical protein
VASMNEPGSRRSFLQYLKDLLRRLRRQNPPPVDPYADRLVPVRRGPKGRSGAAAVAEPDEDFRDFRRGAR